MMPTSFDVSERKDLFFLSHVDRSSSYRDINCISGQNSSNLTVLFCPSSQFYTIHGSQLEKTLAINNSKQNIRSFKWSDTFKMASITGKIHDWNPWICSLRHWTQPWNHWEGSSIDQEFDLTNAYWITMRAVCWSELFAVSRFQLLQFLRHVWLSLNAGFTVSCALRIHQSQLKESSEPVWRPPQSVQ